MHRHPPDNHAPKSTRAEDAAGRRPAAGSAAGVPDDPRSFLPGGAPGEVREQGVLAYFRDPGGAARAADELRDAGFAVSMERFHPQAVDRADTGQQPVPRIGLEDHLEADLPVNPLTQTTTLVATSASGHRREQAMEIVMRCGGDLGV